MKYWNYFFALVFILTGAFLALEVIGQFADEPLSVSGSLPRAPAAPMSEKLWLTEMFAGAIDGLTAENGEMRGTPQPASNSG